MPNSFHLVMFSIVTVYYGFHLIESFFFSELHVKSLTVLTDYIQVRFPFNRAIICALSHSSRTVSLEAFYSVIGCKSVSSPSCKHLRYKQLSGFELRHDASGGLVNVEILGHFNDCSNCLNLLLLAYIYSLCKFGDVSPVKSH